MQRRDFFKKAMTVAGSVAAGASTMHAKTVTETVHPVDDRKVSDVAFPQKRPLITYSDRPPLLETPREVFTSKLTPNDLFFVRWHMPVIPTRIVPYKFFIHIRGEVEKEVKISLHTLKTEFEPVEITAVLQCGGNNRTAFKPTASGIQWGVGAMGCAKWKGVRLKDLLKKAGLKKDAAWLGFNGAEKAVYNETSDFIRELSLTQIHDDIIIAYEMNGEDLPYLNGYPVRLVIPGFYSDSWIKMLSSITVSKEKKALLFMDHAYRIPDNDCECETPDSLAKTTKPIEKMNVNSLIGYPVSGTKVQKNANLIVRGVAFDGGHGIKGVQISTDGGKIWNDAVLDDGTPGQYAYRAFTYAYKPEPCALWQRPQTTKGKHSLLPMKSSGIAADTDTTVLMKSHWRSYKVLHIKKYILIPALIASSLFSNNLLAKDDNGIKMPYVDFPMKEAKGMYSTKGKCNMCHSFGYIINQGKQSKKFWHDKVIKMITVFKAPIKSNEDIETVTNYLFENYGNGELE